MKFYFILFDIASVVIVQLHFFPFKESSEDNKMSYLCPFVLFSPIHVSPSTAHNLMFFHCKV
jgi:hypothetical protein